MSTEPPREHESTYVVQDRDNLEEMTRLSIQDKMLTTGMGGVFPELADPGLLRRILDVGCGTGGWLVETGRRYPTIKTLVGVDISDKMLSYARTQAARQDLSSRVQFEAADALRALPFGDGFFDLVNQRLGLSWLRTWEWKKLLTEYQRVTRPGGIIRITESHLSVESNSPALEKLCRLVIETFYHSGRLFTPSNDGVTGELVRLMRQHGIQNVKSQIHTRVYRPDTPEGQYFYEDTTLFFRVGLPFLRKWIRVPSDYHEICEQAHSEMQQPDFVATMTLLTVWGIRPNGPIPLMRGLQ